MDEIGTGEKGDVYCLALTVSTFHAFTDFVDFVLEVVEDFGGSRVFFLLGLPGVDHKPVRGFVNGELAHCYPESVSV